MRVEIAGAVVFMFRVCSDKVGKSRFLAAVVLPSRHVHNYGNRFLMGKVQAQARIKKPNVTGLFEQSEKIFSLAPTRRRSPSLDRKKTV
jgi:hypothetical protein